jgi:hypothetical protein
MYPFIPDPDWYHRFWFAERAKQSPWRRPSILAILTAVLAVIGAR